MSAGPPDKAEVECQWYEARQRTPRRCGSSGDSTGATTLDEVGRITRIDGLTPGTSWIYTYDDLDQLLSADNLGDDNRDESFTYDDGGNMLSRSSVGTYVYPGTGLARPHAPLTAGAFTFAYDDNGNAVTDGTHTSAWGEAGKRMIR